MSDAALIELVSRILSRDHEVVEQAVQPLAEPHHTVSNAAERLLTGRLAEEYFLNHSADLVGIACSEVLDQRDAACGFDFGVRSDAGIGIEVKGLKALVGSILFTDREWREASVRKENYWLVVVGNVGRTPRARVVRDPQATLPASCRYQRTIAAQWVAPFTVETS